MYKIDLKLFRKQNNLTQIDMAEILGCKQSFISQIETGYRQIPDEYISILLALDGYNMSAISKTMALSEAEPSYNIDESNSIGVPYYEDLDVTASLVTSFSDYAETPTFKINYKHFNDCDAYLPVMGNSMAPLYCNGDIIAIRKIINLDALLPGETYLVITNSEANSLRTIKRVYYSPDRSKILLRATNPDYAGDIEIFKKDIISIYFVKGKITRNEL
ncbi:MAG: hypothetical protein BGO30_09215 [Bacteroidetes bacterium 41-46]|nr:MAG: hypothetical protein BGO30_09215 [Bacteroidetes bacterium 41-46]